MTPPLADTGFGEAERDIEALLDEYAQASGLDPRRAALIADAIFDKARASGLARESGISDDTPRAEALTKLDAWLCDVKDLRLGDGLHVFGQDAPGEIAGLLAALDGRFVEPGPAGAPSRARRDVLPTGRNLFGVDPRSVPTRTAHAIGEKAAQAVLTRYLQDNGDYPRALMIDLWGSSTMRTGGEDFAQALALHRRASRLGRRVIARVGIRGDDARRISAVRASTSPCASPACSATCFPASSICSIRPCGP